MSKEILIEVGCGSCELLKAQNMSLQLKLEDLEIQKIFLQDKVKFLTEKLMLYKSNPALSNLTSTATLDTPEIS